MNHFNHFGVFHLIFNGISVEIIKGRTDGLLGRKFPSSEAVVNVALKGSLEGGVELLTLAGF